MLGDKVLSLQQEDSVLGLGIRSTVALLLLLFSFPELLEQLSLAVGDLWKQLGNSERLSTSEWSLMKVSVFSYIPGAEGLVL